MACIDGRSAASRALMQWRSEILASLGGEANLSSMELTVVEQACRNRLLLDSVDAWLLSQPSLVNRKRKALLPVIAQRMQLDAALLRTLTTLGLKRREKEVTLHDYIAANYGGRDERADSTAPEPPDDATDAPAAAVAPEATEETKP